MNRLKKLRYYKNKLTEVEEASLMAQRATGLLLTVSFVILPFFWSRMLNSINPDLNRQENYDPWAEFNML